MPTYNVKAFTVQLVRASTGTAITVGDGGDAAKDVWALPHPRDLVLQLLGVDSSFQETMVASTEANVRTIARNVLKYAVSSSYSTEQSAAREGHEWDGQAWADVSANPNKFAFVFEIVHKDAAGHTTLVLHQAGQGTNDVAGVVQYCIAVQGTKV